MIGIDVSSWQNRLSLEENKDMIDFVIMKATEGIGFTDKCFPDFAIQSTKLGLLQGCYHFARPDLHGTVETMRDEAEWFVNIVDKYNLLGKAILVLDWETEPIDREDLILAWLNKVVELTGIKPFIYGSKSKLSKSTFKNIIKEWPVWMAAYPDSSRLSIFGANKWVYEFGPVRNTVPWIIWQFSSTGLLSGFNGNVDLNYTDISKEYWKILASKHESSYQPTESETLTEDMCWAIDIGLIKGDGNGKYYPKEPLTREHAVTLLRRALMLLGFI